MSSRKVCNDCGRGFRSQSELQAHRQLVHDAHICVRCDQDFTDRAALERHQSASGVNYCEACCRNFRTAEAFVSLALSVSFFEERLRFYQREHLRQMSTYRTQANSGNARRGSQEYERAMRHFSVIRRARYRHDVLQLDPEALFELEPVPVSQAINAASSDEDNENASSGSETHSYLDGNVSNAALSDREGSSDEEEHTSSEEDREQSDDNSDADNDGNGGESERHDSDMEVGDSDDESSGSQFSSSSGFSELRRAAATQSRPKALTEGDDHMQVRFKCPLCFEEKSDLSCGKCGHVFCTA